MKVEKSFHMEKTPIERVSVINRGPILLANYAKGDFLRTKNLRRKVSIHHFSEKSFIQKKFRPFSERKCI